MTGFAFEFISLPAERSTGKPRRSGLTSIYDNGLPLEAQKSMIHMAGQWIDFAKLVSASSRVIPESVLHEKINIYLDAGIRP